MPAVIVYFVFYSYHVRILDQIWTMNVLVLLTRHIAFAECIHLNCISIRGYTPTPTIA